MCLLDKRLPNFSFFLFVSFVKNIKFSPYSPYPAFACTRMHAHVLYSPRCSTFAPKHTHTFLCSLTALRLGSLVSGILSSKSRSSQMSDSRQTPTSSVQSKFLRSGGEMCCFECPPVIQSPLEESDLCLTSCDPDGDIIALDLDVWVFKSDRTLFGKMYLCFHP